MSLQTVLPKDFLSDGVVIKHLQISQSNIQELHDDSLLPLKMQLESFGLVSSKLSEIPQKAFRGFDKLLALDLEANVVNDIPSYSFYGLHLIKINLKGNKIEKVSFSQYITILFLFLYILSIRCLKSTIRFFEVM